jgi:hypothetical protein
VTRCTPLEREVREKVRDRIHDGTFAYRRRYPPAP